MLRHMDCALEASDGRMVLGFFAVEGARDGTVPAVWAKSAEATISPAALDGSLPHRNGGRTDTDRSRLPRCDNLAGDLSRIRN